MSKMRILSKKTFALGTGASRSGGPVDQLITVRGSIQEIDTRYKNDLTFKRAVAAGEIIIMNDDISASKSTIIVEPEKVEPVKKEVDESLVENTPDPVAEFKEKLKLMNASEVKELAEKYGATFEVDGKLRENKKRVFEAYKLSLSE